MILGFFFFFFISTVSNSNLINYFYSSYSTYHDMEVFLHGLGLEHIRGLLEVILWYICYLWSNLWKQGAPTA